MKRIPPLVVTFLLLVFPAVAQESLVNFNHLAHLTERIFLNGDSVSIVHVYADFPDYQWVDAKGKSVV